MPATALPTALRERVDGLAWDDLRAGLDADGFAVTEPLLTEPETSELAELFDDGTFRSVGTRHGVSTITAGRRTALGIIFHDSR